MFMAHKNVYAVKHLALKPPNHSHMQYMPLFCCKGPKLHQHYLLPSFCITIMAKTAKTFFDLVTLTFHL